MILSCYTKYVQYIVMNIQNLPEAYHYIHLFHGDLCSTFGWNLISILPNRCHIDRLGADAILVEQDYHNVNDTTQNIYSFNDYVAKQWK